MPGLCYSTHSVRFGSVNTCQSLGCIYREFNQILYLFHSEVAALVDGFVLNKLQTAEEVSKFTYHQKRERHIFLPESDLNCCYSIFFLISIFILVYVLMTGTYLLLFKLKILLSTNFAFTNIRLDFFPPNIILQSSNRCHYQNIKESWLCNAVKEKQQGSLTCWTASNPGMRAQLIKLHIGESSCQPQSACLFTL